MSQPLSPTFDGHVAEIALTRPELLNRFDVELRSAFTHVLIEAASMASDDLAEAVAAFRERREPKYQGR